MTSRIAAIRAAAAGSPTPAPDTDPDDDTNNPGDPAKAAKPKKKDDQMSDENNALAIASARNEAAVEATKAERARTSAVLASTEYAGREALANSLLASDLPSDQIIAALTAAPKAAVATPDAAAVTAAAEAAARAEMQRLATAGGNPDLEGADEPSAPDKTKAASDVWDRAYSATDALRQK